jgi:hypothetical protein
MAARPISRTRKVLGLAVAALLCAGGAVWLLYLNLFAGGVLGNLGLAAAIAFGVGLVLVWRNVRRWPESELPKTWDTH